MLLLALKKVSMVKITLLRSPPPNKKIALVKLPIPLHWTEFPTS